MPKILRTPDNPYGLSVKQRMVIRDMVADIKEGRPFNPTKSHQKYYNVGKNHTASVISNENFNRPYFTDAFCTELEYQGVLGVSGKLIQVISSGLDAYKIYKNERVPDHKTRLKYIQEVFKIAGLYSN